MRLRNWLGVSLGLLVGALAGCQQNHWSDYWSDIRQCDHSIEQALSATEVNGMDPKVSEIQRELEVRIDKKDIKVSVRQIVDQAIGGYELCGDPYLKEGELEFDGTFIPLFDEEIEVDGELKYFDKVIVFSEQGMFDLLEKRNFNGIEYLLDFYVNDEEGKKVLSEDLIEDYFMGAEDPYLTYDETKRGFSDLYHLFGEMGSLDSHEYAHWTLFVNGFDHDHPITHEQIQADPNLTYADDFVTQCDQSVQAIVSDPVESFFRGEWLKDIYCKVSEEREIFDDHYNLYCVVWE